MVADNLQLAIESVINNRKNTLIDSFYICYTHFVLIDYLFGKKISKKFVICSHGAWSKSENAIGKEGNKNSLTFLDRATFRTFQTP